MVGLIGRKLGMTRVFDAAGAAVPVTVVQAGPCVVTQVKQAEKDGYRSVQLGYGDRKEKSTPQPLLGHFQKAQVAPQRVLQEFALDGEYRLGQSIGVEVFSVGDRVHVTGISKGKGTAGVVKRHKFHGGPKTHGQTDRHRHAGSVGSTTYPGRVLRGKRMAGHMGSERVTVRNLRIIGIDKEQNLLWVEGAVPGPARGYLRLRKAG
jgi:large subunit ribosomal protein L3